MASQHITGSFTPNFCSVSHLPVLCCCSKQKFSLAARKLRINQDKSNYGFVSDEQWQNPLLSPLLASRNGKNNALVLKNTTMKFDQVITRQSLVEQGEVERAVDTKKLVDFLYEDWPHYFDDQGIDRTGYDELLRYRDPITKHDSISGYLFNIAMLKVLFRPDYKLHWVKQTGPYELTTRWTVVMTFILLPWKPELSFTGTSVMGVNPETNKFCSHVDYWDSIKNNDYFSVEGLLEVFKQVCIFKTSLFSCFSQLRIYKTPDVESPNYQILKKTATYEVRKYDPFIVLETNGDQLVRSRGVNDVTGIFTVEKIPITTPVFTQSFDTDESQVSIHKVLPMQKDMNSLRAPNQEAIGLREVEGGTGAVLKFSGKPSINIVEEKEKELRLNLIKDGLKPKPGCLFARYNDPGRTWHFIMRSEVLIWLEDFSTE